MIAVLACKLCRSLIRLLGRGGTDFPGRVALKLCPNLLGELAKTVTTVIVTGTNGKTTTSRMIEQSWTDAGISFFANKSGANLLSGVTAEFAVHSTLTGRCKYPYALIEADEAALKFISKYVDAKVIVFTNVFRDQLDRYGEVTHTLEKLRIGVKNSPNAIGYASLSAVEGKEGIKALTVNGVACSEETVLDGSYEIQRPFVLVTKSDASLSTAAQAFFDYATSKDASELIRNAGAVPVAE